MLSISAISSIITQNSCAIDKDTLWMDIGIEFDSVDSGRLTFLLRTAGQIDPMEISNLSVPSGIGTSDNNNLKRVMGILDSRFGSPGSLFRSFLDSDGEVELTRTEFRVLNSTSIYAFSFKTLFEFEKDGSTKEYDILPFARVIQYPSVSSSNPLSAQIRSAFKEELRLAHIIIDIEPGAGRSLDLQFEGSGHDRDLSGETVRLHSNLDEVRSNGNSFKISSSPLFAPKTVFFLSTFFLLGSLISLGIIWYRNRFRGPGLVLPVLLIILLPLPHLLFYNPNINIYGTHDSLLFLSLLLLIGLCAGCFFINPRPGEKKVRSYEDEKTSSFEMPKVIYMEKTVYYRKKGIGDSGIDPYDVLGVTRSMSTDDIRRHYKEQILRFHPDKFHNGEDRIRDLSRRETERLNQAFDAICKERGEKT